MPEIPIQRGVEEEEKMNDVKCLETMTVNAGSDRSDFSQRGGDG